MPKRHKRTHILIDSFQYRLVAFNLLYFLIVLILTAIMLFAPLMMKLENSSLSLAERQEVASLILTLHTWFWPVIVVVFLLLAVHSVFISHRMVGALYRLQRVVREVAEGDLTVRVTLRRNDYLMKEAEALNEMIAALHGGVAGVVEQVGAVARALSDLKAAIGRGSPQEARQALQDAEAQMERLRRGLDHFKVAGEKNAVEGDGGVACSASPEGRSRSPARG